jgi:hypothetical protein
MNFHDSTTPYPKAVTLTLALLLGFVLVLTALALVPAAPVAAADGPSAEQAPGHPVTEACSHMSTRWVNGGCCACNNRQEKKQICIYGTWYNTSETRCNYGSCCAYPCCV